MAFGDLFRSVVVAALSLTVVQGLLFWLFREWLSTRIRFGIQHEYDRQLEAFRAQLKTEHERTVIALKAELASEVDLQSAARTSFAEGQKAAIDHKLDAVDKLWRAVVRLRSGLPAVLWILDAVTPDEYVDVRNSNAVKQYERDARLADFAVLVPPDIEEARPWAGEYMWALFYCYQTLLLRIVVLVGYGQTGTGKFEWYKDAGNRGLLGAVFTPAELEEFDKTQFGKVRWMIQRLELRFLDAAQRVISGESLGKDALQQAVEIQRHAARVSAMRSLEQ